MVPSAAHAARAVHHHDPARGGAPVRGAAHGGEDGAPPPGRERLRLGRLHALLPDAPAPGLCLRRHADAAPAPARPAPRAPGGGGGGGAGPPHSPPCRLGEPGGARPGSLAPGAAGAHRGPPVLRAGHHGSSPPGVVRPHRAPGCRRSLLPLCRQQPGEPGGPPRLPLAPRAPAPPGPRRPRLPERPLVRGLRPLCRGGAGRRAPGPAGARDLHRARRRRPRPLAPPGAAMDAARVRPRERAAGRHAVHGLGDRPRSHAVGAAPGRLPPELRPRLQAAPARARGVLARRPRGERGGGRGLSLGRGSSLAGLADRHAPRHRLHHRSRAARAPVRGAAAQRAPDDVLPVDRSGRRPGRDRQRARGAAALRHHPRVPAGAGAGVPAEPGPSRRRRPPAVPGPGHRAAPGAGGRAGRRAGGPPPFGAGDRAHRPPRAGPDAAGHASAPRGAGPSPGHPALAADAQPLDRRALQGAHVLRRVSRADRPRGPHRRHGSDGEAGQARRSIRPRAAARHHAPRQPAHGPARDDPRRLLPRERPHRPRLPAAGPGARTERGRGGPGHGHARALRVTRPGA